jgi:hypothetical protein
MVNVGYNIYYQINFFSFGKINKKLDNNKMKTIKIVGIIILILLLIALLILAGILIYKALHPTPIPTPTPTQIVKRPDNRNTVYQIKGKLVRYDPDLYTGEIAKNSSQHPDYVKLVRRHKRRKYDDN